MLRTAARTRRSRFPKRQRFVPGDVREVRIRGQQQEIVSNAKLRDQCIDGPDLNTALSASIAKFCSGDVILPVGIEQWKGCEALNDLLPRLGAGKPLQQFLQHQSGGEYGLPSLK